MKQITIFIVITISLTLIFNTCTHQSDFPVLKGPYLGQKPPGMTPELFAPGIISNGFHELGLTISPKGDEMFYIMSDKNYSHYVIVNTCLENGKWTKPELAPFTSDYTNYALSYSPTGFRLYFSSKRPLPGTTKLKEDFDIWFVENINDRWSEAQHLTELSSEFNETSMCFAANGRMYLHISKPKQMENKGNKPEYMIRNIELIGNIIKILVKN